jgi:hypothetical protein
MQKAECMLSPDVAWRRSLQKAAPGHCRRSTARSEAAKDAEAEYTAKQLQQHLPVGPQYLSREELIQQVKPSDAEMALCSLYSNRCATQVSVMM